MKLPNQGNIIFFCILIGADESHLLGNSGRDKQAIKGIAVV